MGIFMGLCEEFPELYDRYVGKIENEMRDYEPELEITEEEKAQAIEKIWNQIKSEDWE